MASELPHRHKRLRFLVQVSDTGNAYYIERGEYVSASKVSLSRIMPTVQVRDDEGVLLLRLAGDRVVIKILEGPGSNGRLNAVGRQEHASEFILGALGETGAGMDEYLSCEVVE